jgi:hypothetical protein
MIVALALLALLCSIVPAALFLRNLALYREPPACVPVAGVSILIPARNEAAGISEAVRAALRSRDVAFEVVVMDDSSTDGTDNIVTALAAQDSRVRLEHAPTLPAGWNGKQHACWALAHTARYPILCFVDADVRLAPDCVSRMASLLENGANGLVSGFPRQVTVTFLEWMLLPLIHFVLLGFLPLGRMRRGTNPAFAAGCGQFIMADKESYFACGGHSGIKLTMHDGLKLPRLFREHGLRTDLADLTNLATCRMYSSAEQVWSGLAKNATEGIASPSRIVPITIILLLGQVLPFVILVMVPAMLLLLSLVGIGLVSKGQGLVPLLVLYVLAAGAAWLPRILSISRFKQPWRSALLHPLAILLLLAVQWYSLARKLSGRAVSWRDRAYVEQ